MVNQNLDQSRSPPNDPEMIDFDTSMKISMVKLDYMKLHEEKTTLKDDFFDFLVTKLRFGSKKGALHEK